MLTLNTFENIKLIPIINVQQSNLVFWQVCLVKCVTKMEHKNIGEWYPIKLCERIFNQKEYCRGTTATLHLIWVLMNISSRQKSTLSSVVAFWEYASNCWRLPALSSERENNVFSGSLLPRLSYYFYPKEEMRWFRVANSISYLDWFRLVLL